MNVLTEIFRFVVIGFAALFFLGWLVYGLLILRALFLCFIGRSSLQQGIQDPRLGLLRKWLNWFWWAGFGSALILLAVAAIIGILRGELHFK